MASLSKKDASGASQADISRHLDLTATRVRQLITEGVLAAGSTIEKARLDYIRHLRSAAGRRGDNSEEAKRYALARARKAEIEAARAERELVPVAEAHAWMVAIVGEMVSGLVGLPARCTRDPANRRVIEAEIDALRERVAARINEMAKEYSLALDAAEAANGARR